MSARHTRPKPKKAEHRRATRSGLPSRAAREARGDRTEVEREALSVTHWFDSGTEGEPYTARVRFSGRLAEHDERHRPQQTFTKDETIPGVVPGSGPVSVTTHVYDLAPGDWVVTAELVDGPPRSTTADRKAARVQTLPRAAWSWRRWALSTATFAPVRTRWSPTVRLAPMPAVIPGTWIGLVTLGVIVGMAMQGVLLAREGLPVTPSLVLTGLAALAGLAGAKLRYIAMHPKAWRERPTEGWAVDGFLVVMPIAVILGLLVLDLPIGIFIDASTPALFAGVAIGRLGCFFTGCCAGRCTRSRWGIFSSDRRVGARRIPTQLLEAAAGLVIGAVAFAVLVAARPPIPGLIFVVAIAVYTGVRRVLLRVRAARQELAASRPGHRSARRSSSATG